MTWTRQIAANIIKTSMVRLDRLFQRRNIKARIIMMIHDPVWVEAPEEEENEVRRRMRRMMTTALKLDVPMEVDLA